MAATAFQHLFLLVLHLLACFLVKSAEEPGFASNKRGLFYHFQYKALQHDVLNQPSTIYQLTPTTPPTPATIPTVNPAPAIVTAPATNPVANTPNPVPTPGTMPSPTLGSIPGANPASPIVPVTIPVTTPVTNPGAQPVTSPTPTPTPTPIPIPTPATTIAPAIPGKSWCVAKTGISENSLQTALDYACGFGGADCSAIQQGGSCYNPNSLQDHASFAFNCYYQKNPVQTSCDFGGTAMVTNQNPSTGSCIYLTSLTSGTPSATPTTASSTGAAVPAGSSAPPNLLNTTTYPAFGGTSTGIIGASPPADGSSISASNHFRASCVTFLAYIITSAIL